MGYEGLRISHSQAERFEAGRQTRVAILLAHRANRPMLSVEKQTGRNNLVMNSTFCSH
jgi:hypothetical protein